MAAEMRFSNAAAGLKNIVGGELRGYSELLSEARQEAFEMAVIQEFMPTALGADELAAVVQDALASSGASSNSSRGDARAAHASAARAAGARIRTDAAVRQILVAGGRASGVPTGLGIDRLDLGL